MLLRAMGYPKETQIYVASGQVYGGHNRMAPLRNMFPNLVNITYYLISFNHGTCLMKCGLIIVSSFLDGVAVNSYKFFFFNASKFERT